MIFRQTGNQRHSYVLDRASLAGIECVTKRQSQLAPSFVTTLVSVREEIRSLG